MIEPLLSAIQYTQYMLHSQNLTTVPEKVKICEELSAKAQ